MTVDVLLWFDRLPPPAAFGVLFVLVLFVRLVWGFGSFLTSIADEVMWKWSEKRRGVTDEL